MDNKNKVIIALSVVIVLLCGLTSISWLFAGSDPETACEPEIKEVIKEVPGEAKIEYKDTPETTRALTEAKEVAEAHRVVACTYAIMYPSMFEVVKESAIQWGLTDMLTPEMYDLATEANTYQNSFCK